MQIDRAFVEARLAEVRAQGQQALSLFQQTQGAEIMLNAMLKHLDEAEAQADAQANEAASLGADYRAPFREPLKPRGTSARKNGHAEGLGANA